ncbi:hypothetical protein [Aureivirga sp. CE67]|uniref:hypothetical protein n=1 Tax=Aureivirga sp. CE67 TaxID=1788983 RepID=UPI0018CBD14B|nr:hypothetical protein [Aureivirga sp. CE67]
MTLVTMKEIMKSKIIILLIIFLTQIKIIAQDLNQLELDKIYIEALNSDYFRNHLKQETIELNDRIERIKNEFTNNEYKYVESENITKYALKNGRKIRIAVIDHLQIGKDTIDINYTYYHVNAKRGIYFFKGKIRFKRAFIALPCGNGKYVPDIRFVFNREKKKWIKVEKDLNTK